MLQQQVRFVPDFIDDCPKEATEKIIIDAFWKFIEESKAKAAKDKRLILHTALIDFTMLMEYGGSNDKTNGFLPMK